MSVRRTQVIAPAVATVVAAGLLSAVATVPAAAEPTTTTYSCTFPELDEVDVPVTVDVTNLPRKLPVGIPLEAGDWDVRATVHFDDLTTAYLLGHTHDVIVEVKGFETLLGERSVVLDAASGVEVLPVAEPLDVPMAGGNRELTPKTLEEDVPLELPEAFTLDLYDGDHAPLFSVECEWWDGDLGVIGTVSVVKQTSSMTRKLLTKPVKTTKRAKIQVEVLTQEGVGATGQVVAMLGDRTLATRELSDGRVTLKLPRLQAGKHRVTLTYQGTKVVDRTTRNVTVKVVRPTS